MVDVLLDGVSKRYGDDWAVRDMSLRIESGEAVVLLGPSGSGKTTVLRLIAGLETPTSGYILFDGKTPDEEPSRRDVTMLFAENRLYPKMTARGNIEFPLSLRKTPEPERSHRIEAGAATFGIERLLQRMPSQLSAGESNLVHLAKAMIRAPGLFLVDEPMSALDTRARFQLRGSLREIQRGYGVTAVYATHDQEDAMTLGDRLVVLNEGSVRQAGPPPEVYARPADTFVATFVGTPPMSLLEAEVVPGGLRMGHWTINAPRELPSEVTVGVRPGDWKVHRGGLAATVEDVDDQGTAQYLRLGTPVGMATMRWEDPKPSVGSVVEIDPTRYHIFDRATGRALHHS